MEHLTEEQKIAKSISAMYDSVWVINDEMAKQPSINTLNTILRNFEHLELMMSKSEIINSGEDFSSVTQAIEAGKTFYNENKSIFELE